MRNDLRLHDNECFHYINGIAKQIKGNGNEPNNSGLSLIPYTAFNMNITKVAHTISDFQESASLGHVLYFKLLKI